MVVELVERLYVGGAGERVEDLDRRLVRDGIGIDLVIDEICLDALVDDPVLMTGGPCHVENVHEPPPGHALDPQ